MSEGDIKEMTEALVLIGVGSNIVWFFLTVSLIIWILNPNKAFIIFHLIITWFNKVDFVKVITNTNF